MSDEPENKVSAKKLRDKAVEKLSHLKTKAGKRKFDAENIRLKYELSVHQIELEMQNEELRSVNNTLETTLTKYTTMYYFSPMGYITLNEKGIIEEINYVGAEMLGEKRSGLIKNLFRLYVYEDSRPLFDNFLKMVYLSKNKKSCRMLIGRYSQHITKVHLEAIVTDNDNKCLLSILNIHEFDKLENNFL
jgi:PAS domain-containing protein